VLLHEILELAVADRPDAAALVGDGRRLTFAELASRVEHLSQLIERTCSVGDRVVLVSDNHVDVVVALYAVPRAGAVLTFANTRHTGDELAHLITSTTPSLVVAAPTHLDRLLAAWTPDPTRAPRIWSLGGTHGAAALDVTTTLDGDGPDAGPDAGPPPPPLDDGTCAWLIHTSGSTGRPKGVELTHSSLLAAVLNTAVGRPLADDDVYLFPFPLFHVAAYNVLHAHLRRRPVVLVPRFDAAHLLEVIGAEGVTSCSLAPTMLAMLLDHAGDGAARQLSGLRQISYGASAMPLELLRRVTRELPDCGLAQGYGMTELSGNAVFLGPEEHRRAASDRPDLLGAAGRPGPLVALRIVDDDGQELPAGGAGEIWVRGDQVCAGYWRDPAATQASRVGPWLRTGDVGRIDELGLLHVVDRKKDLIITGGENVASREVEDHLGAHPAIAQVAVVGVPDPRWGESVCAVIVARAGQDLEPDDVVAWTDGRMAGFKRPRRVVVLDELPTNASGKVDKTALRSALSPDQPH
jgi:acyl-CoA synthetase (AMP-forming)/AMP-acid ligase II